MACSESSSTPFLLDRRVTEFAIYRLRHPTRFVQTPVETSLSDTRRGASLPRRGVGPLGWLLALTLLSGQAFAGDLQLSQARIGYRGAEPGKAVMLHGGVEGQSAWLPCELVLNNVGEGSFSGNLEVQEHTADRSEPPIRHPLSLEPRAKKRLRFSVLFRPSSRYQVSFLDRERGRIELAEVSGTGTVLRGGLSVPQIRTIQEPLVLVVRGAESLSTQLRDLQGEFLDLDTTAREWRAVELEGVGAVPDQVTALHRVSLLILDDVDLPSLSEAQQRALLAWVGAGGRLWVSTLKADTSGPLGQILPGQGSGEVVEGRSLAGLEPSLGTIPQLEAAKEKRVFDPRPGDVVWATRGRSELLHRRHGRGWVVRAGFSLSRARFDKRALLRELLVLHQEARAASLVARRLLGELSMPLNASTLKRMPSRGTAIGVVAFYALFGVAIPFAIFRRGGRLELAWGCVLLSTVLATAVVFALGKETEQESRIVRVSLVEGGAAGPNLQASAMGVFSKSGGPLTLEFATPSEGALLLGTTREEALRREGLSASLNGQGYILETDPQDTTLLATQELVELPGWVRLTQTGPSSARVERSGGWELKGAWAFDNDGQPFRDLETPRELATGPRHLDPVLETAFKGLLEVASARALERQQPLLVFWWEGNPRQSALPEFGLDVGFVWASPGWGAWGKRPTQVVKYGIGVPVPKSSTVHWPFHSPLPDPTRAGVLSVVSAEQTFQLRNWTRGTYVTPIGYASLRRHRVRTWGGRKEPDKKKPVLVPGGLRVTPLGVAIGEIVVPGGDVLTDPSDVVRLVVSSSRQPAELQEGAR